MRTPRIAGIVNLTDDSFSDGGRYVDPDAAVARALDLVRAGADVIDLGAASSRPEAHAVAADEEIRRLAPVLDQLLAQGVRVSVDSWQPEAQRYALGRGVAYLNDIRGFPEPALYDDLAAATCKLVVMHSVEGGERAPRVWSDPATILERTMEFLRKRLAALEAAGVDRARLIVDPGMGFFLGSNPEASLVVLRNLERLRELGAPIWVSVSRKSFLGQLTGRRVAERGAATLAVELYVAGRGADYIRTHEPQALKDALVVLGALEGA